jgi:hypothetical protein
LRWHRSQSTKRTEQLLQSTQLSAHKGAW